MAVSLDYCPLCGAEDVGDLSDHLGTPEGEGCHETPQPPEGVEI